MSCQVKLTANIVDVSSIRRHLFPTDDNRGGDNWLQNSQLSVSPTGDVIALVHEKRLVILTGKWDTQTTTNQFQSIHDTNFTECKENIKAVLCLPIVIQSHSSQVGPDWTCIVLGFESGLVGFYTEDCTLLLEEQLHNEPVASLKCQSQHNPRPDISPELKPEELYVIYPSNVCVIGGSQLFTTLRSCRSQLVRVRAFGQAAHEVSLQSTNPKKWGFVDQGQINDVSVVGLDLSNTFDHLLTASTCGGFESKYRAMPPHNSLLIGAGSKPYIGFHYALEGGAQPVLSDVAKAVASKLKSALPGWLTGTKSTQDKSLTVSTQPSEPMGCRFGLCDIRRSAHQIVLSPDRKLVAVSDALGRVILIETHHGVALRIFKGYRDAQCAFVQVPDERRSRHKSKNAVALFLVIYSGKKGTLEIFTAQQGMKIATFTASKFSKLLYINYGLMGFQNTSKSRFVCQYTCVLIDPDGQIKELIIPFHFALTEKNSKRARDLHLYKRLKQFIKAGDKDNEKLLTESLNTCNELKTVEVKQQCIEMLVSCNDISAEIIISCAEAFLEQIASISDEGEVESEAKQLKTTCRNLISLSKFFIFVSGISLDVENGNLKHEDTKLILPEKEMRNLQRLLDLSTLNDQIKNNKVTFREENEFVCSEFISVFEHSNQIKLKLDVVENKLFKASEKIFRNYISCSNDYEELENNLKSSNMPPKDLFNLLLLYWVQRPLYTYQNLEREMENFSQTILALTKGINPDEILVEYNKISSFWSDIREILANSAKPFPALMAAMLCKNVAHTIERETEAAAAGLDDSIEIWEKLSQENCKWTLLIGKLEDVSLLNIILANKPVCEATLPKLKIDSVDVSLKFILEKGKGSVGEIVGQWLAAGGVNPESIVLNDLNEVEDQPIFHHLNTLKKQFPYSLEPSVLLANMCWEYALVWQKEPQDMNLLKAALKCLVCIPNLHIKSGMYNLVWNTHLKIIFECTCKLINKVGKLPKERLCRQDTDLTDYQITLFMEICAGFFDGFMETLAESCNYEVPTLKYEQIWENGGTPLAQLALSQNSINYDLLHLHFQLTTCIHMMTVFTIKHSKIMNNLFDPSATMFLFTDLQQKGTISHHKCDSRTSASRLQFLIKVISATLETITVDDDIIYSVDHVAWMAKCLALARVWNLDVDMLKRYQVVRIFANGFDVLGEELLPSVTDRSKLGPELVCVAGKRLSQFLEASQDLGEKIVAFSTTLTNYLDNLNGDRCAPCDLESIMTLIMHCLRCLEENQSEYKTACLMLEACSTLQDLVK